MVHKAVCLGARFVLTPSIETELVGMSLSRTLEAWRQEGVLERCKVRARDTRTLNNTIAKKIPRPGRNDQALVCLATQHDAVVLTHDTGLARYAEAASLLTIDLVDVAALLLHHKTVSVDALDALFQHFNTPHAYHPSDWKGSFESTRLARPYMTQLIAQLCARLEP